MNNENIINNGVNGAGTNVEGSSPGRCSVEQQRRSGRNPVTANAKVEWKKEINKIAVECYLRSEPTRRGFRKRMLQIWNEIGMFSLTEQQLAGQVLCIRDGKYLTELEIEEIRRKINEPIQIEAEEEQMDNHVDPINDSGAMQSIDNRENRQANVETDLDTEGLSDEQLEILKMLKEKLRQPENLQPLNEPIQIEALFQTNFKTIKRKDPIGSVEIAFKRFSHFKA